MSLQSSKFVTSAAVKASAKAVGSKAAAVADGKADGTVLTIGGREYKVSNQTASANGVYTATDLKKKVGCVLRRQQRSHSRILCRQTHSWAQE